MNINSSTKPMDEVPRVQQSIRSFFQPRTPSYTAPPAARASEPDSNGASTSNSTGATLLPSNSASRSTNGTAHSLPKQASISPIREEHIQQLRRINTLLLSINYPDSFYHNILNPTTPVSFSRVILWRDSPSTDPKVVGGLVCRLDTAPSPQSSSPDSQSTVGCFDIYIQSLALLSPYRTKGLATSLVSSIISSAVSQSNMVITSLYAHAWTENTEALDWYTARGFKKEGPVIEGYYRKLKPSTAWILRKKLSTSDHLAYSLSPVSFHSSGPDRPSPIPYTASKSEPIASAHTPSASSTTLPSPLVHTTSYQDRRPDREWNDLPQDVLSSSLLMPPGLSSRGESAASSRSSSRNGRKKRQYPAAAFEG